MRVWMAKTFVIATAVTVIVITFIAFWRTNVVWLAFGIGARSESVIGETLHFSTEPHADTFEFVVGNAVVEDRRLTITPATRIDWGGGYAVMHATFTKWNGQWGWYMVVECEGGMCEMGPPFHRIQYHILYRSAYRYGEERLPIR